VYELYGLSNPHPSPLPKGEGSVLVEGATG
jgi:hypothetical protein